MYSYPCSISHLSNGIIMCDGNANRETRSLKRHVYLPALSDGVAREKYQVSWCYNEEWYSIIFKQQFDYQSLNPA